MKKYLAPMLQIARVVVLFLIAYFIIIAYFPHTSLSRFGFVNDKDDSSHSTLTENSKKSVCDVIISDREKANISKWDGKISRVNYSTLTQASLFRTAINEQVAEGPNFAGHYRVVSWGCGTECLGYAVVDVVDGNIVEYVPYMEFQASTGLDYTIDDSLLVFNPKSKKSVTDTSQVFEDAVRSDFEAHKARIYYQLEETFEGKMRLRNICTENILDGTV